jgi:hypothetical protein
MNRLARRLGTVAAAAVMATPALVIPATQADAAGFKITAQMFGMHWLDTSHPYPTVSFGSARIWDMGVTWKDVQPAAPTAGDLLTPASDGWDQSALGRLDGIVDTFRAHHVDPMITLGMTPAWAASNCTHQYGDVDYGVQTCPPATSDANSPWAAYVRALSNRYKGKVTYFELWNEPSLKNGWNGSIAQLVALQRTAYPILHANGQRLIAPSIAFTNGSPQNGRNWLTAYLKTSGARSTFDIAGFHLYPTDAIARANYGPEWAMDQLSAARALLAKYNATKPVWNTEVNVGRAQSRTTFTGTAGAAQVARTYVLNLENRVQRTMWYASDDRHWGGTWLENSDYRSLTYAGIAERTLNKLLVNGTAYGCSRKTVGTHKWNYTCKFHMANGKNLLALWTTGSKYSYHAPSHAAGFYTVTGARHAAHGGTRITITSTPVYVYGTFKI